MKTVTVGIFAGIIFLYALFSGFVAQNFVKIDENELQSLAAVTLTPEQEELASFLFTDSIPLRFRPLPLFIDIFSKKNILAAYTAAFYLAKTDQRQPAISRYFKSLGTRRYIERKINPAVCCNYIFSSMYMGNGIYGLKDAAATYYAKAAADLTAAEFISLYLTAVNPGLYDDMNSETVKNKTAAILQNYTRVKKQLARGSSAAA